MSALFTRGKQDTFISAVTLLWLNMWPTVAQELLQLSHENGVVTMATDLNYSWLHPTQKF
jgi:hypothetical protein